jgi:hypothetical protein
MENKELFKENKSDRAMTQAERTANQERWSELHYAMEKAEQSGQELPAAEKEKIKEEMEQLRQELTK